MRILSTSQLFMPDTTGGTGRVARTLSDALIRRGEQVVALTQRMSADFPAHESVDGLEIFRYGSPRLRRIAGMSASAAIGIRRPLRRLLPGRRFDAAIGHQPVSSLAAAAALRGSGIPELRFFHASGAQETMRRFAPSGPRHLRLLAGSKVTRELRLAQIWKLEREYVLSADHLCFLSHYAETWAARLHGPDLPPSSIIPAGVDTHRFAPPADRDGLRRRLLAGRDDTVVLFTARNLAPRMGLDNLLGAVPALLRRDPAIRLVIAGRGALGAKLERLVSGLGVAHAVTFLGRVGDDVLVQWYQACDLFVLPTAAMEGFGMVTAEAMACGAPVVGTPAGATPDLLEGLHPLLLARGITADHLAAAISRVLARCDLRALRTQVRAHALARYDARLQADRVACLLHEMRQEQRPGLGSHA